MINSLPKIVNKEEFLLKINNDQVKMLPNASNSYKKIKNS